MRKTNTFQSTLPAWGATLQIRKMAKSMANFNPRSPRGERRCISTAVEPAALFQSTLPAWGATRVIEEATREYEISIHAPRVGSDGTHWVRCQRCLISIHAPRVGSDICWVMLQPRQQDFNPRSPRGERLLSSVRFIIFSPISIHAPRVGSDKHKSSI